MDFNQYQIEAGRTAANDLSRPMAIAVWALGLAGEAGEVADLIKKRLGHGHPLDRDSIKKELGDVLWYLAMLAAELEMPLEEIAEANLQKLSDRYPDGFSTQASLHRIK